MSRRSKASMSSTMTIFFYWAELMKVPELASEVSGLFDHVLVDE
jgi:hypothetical protein